MAASMKNDILIDNDLNSQPEPSVNVTNTVNGLPRKSGSITCHPKTDTKTNQNTQFKFNISYQRYWQKDPRHQEKYKCYRYNLQTLTSPDLLDKIVPVLAEKIDEALTLLLIRYARASSNYSDFVKRHLHLRNSLLDQGYAKIRIIRSLKKFIFRY